MVLRLMKICGIFVYSFLIFISYVFATEQRDRPVPVWLDINSYQLLKEFKQDKLNYKLKTSDGTLIEIPLEMLEPPGEQEREENESVSSFKYEPTVSAFPASKNETILHIWSFDAMKEGSMWLARGRDVFVLLDNESKKLYESGLNLEITRSRGRIDGCRWAINNRYLVGDIDSDGYTDLGVIREEISCEEEERHTPVWTTVPYKVDPVKWYVRRNPIELGQTIWWHDPRFDGRLPFFGYAELPIPGLEMSPVDLVLKMLQHQIRLPSGLGKTNQQDNEE